MRRSCVISCDVHDSRFAYFAHRKVRRVPRTQGNLVRVIGNSSRAVFCYECLCFPTRFARVLGRLALYHDGVARSRTVCCSANPTAEVGRVMSLIRCCYRDSSALALPVSSDTIGATQGVFAGVISAKACQAAGAYN
jgi:hypothetical protein